MVRASRCHGGDGPPAALRWFRQQECRRNGAHRGARSSATMTLRERLAPSAMTLGGAAAAGRAIQSSAEPARRRRGRVGGGLGQQLHSALWAQAGSRATVRSMIVNVRSPISFILTASFSIQYTAIPTCTNTSSDKVTVIATAASLANASLSPLHGIVKVPIIIRHLTRARVPVRLREEFALCADTLRTKSACAQATNGWADFGTLANATVPEGGPPVPASQDTGCREDASILLHNDASILLHNDSGGRQTAGRERSPAPPNGSATAQAGRPSGAPRYLLRRT